MIALSQKLKQLMITMILLVVFGIATIYFEANGRLSLSNTLSILAALSFLLGVAFTPEVLFHSVVLKDKKLLSSLFFSNENKDIAN